MAERAGPAAAVTSTGAIAPAALDRNATEAELLAAVVAAARIGGWLIYRTTDTRGSDPGFPDLVLVRGSELLAVELKSAWSWGRVTDGQRRWLAAIDGVVEVEARLVRPGGSAAALMARLARRRPDLDLAVEMAPGPDPMG